MYTVFGVVSEFLSARIGLDRFVSDRFDLHSDLHFADKKSPAEAGLLIRKRIDQLAFRYSSKDTIFFSLAFSLPMSIRTIRNPLDCSNVTEKIGTYCKILLIFDTQERFFSEEKT